jgi:drug/metabolite transporter (DMT)-like permease
VPAGEPFTTALLLTTGGVLLAASVLFSSATRRLGMPVGLVFVAIGMLAGREGLGIAFDDYAFAWRLGTVALALILFDGGLNTPLVSFRVALAPAAVLATAAAFLIQTWAQSLVSPTHIAVALTMEPVFAGVFSAAFGYEQVTVRAVLGAVCVLAGMLIVQLKPGRDRRQTL